MQHKDEGKGVGQKAATSEVDSSEEITMQWLIEQEYAEEPEKLFAVLEEEALDCSLTPLEAEIAARPMIRGDRNLDDLSTYVKEEIVLGATDTSNDIYARPDNEALQREASAEVPMAIDHFALKKAAEAKTRTTIDEGSDILGLSEEDDIGEQFLVIRKAAGVAAEAPSDPGVVAQSTPGSAVEPGADLNFGNTLDSVGREETLAEVPGEERVALSDLAAGLADPVSDDGNDAVADPHCTSPEAGTPAVDSAALAGDPEAPETMHFEMQSQSNSAAAEGAGTVLDYVSNYEPPADDDAFDDYLLQGGHLDEGEVRIEELLVASTEGVAAVDPELDTAIDYHEDFAFEDGLDGDSVSAITRVIAGAMDELSLVIAQRLTSLGLDAEAVQVEVMLGADADAVACCLAQGYSPVDRVCPELPSSLATLGQMEIDAVYVRLFHAESDESWNDLLHDSFTRHLQSNTAVTDDCNAAAEPWSPLFHGEDVVGEFADSDFGFGDDLDGLEIEGSGENKDIAIAALVADDLDTDDWSSLVDEALAPGSEPEPELVVSADLNQPSSPAEASPSLAEMAQTIVPAEEEPGVGDGAPADQPEQISSPVVEHSAVFEDDIFGPDFADELEVEQDVAAADVDALFDSLADSERESDEICGVAVNEFATTESFDETPATDLEVESVATVDAASDMSWCIPADIKFDVTRQSQGEIFVDFLDAFIEEAAAGLEQLEDAMAAWEAEIDSDSAFAPIPRILHTLKGIAKGVGLHRYGTLIHNYETLLDGLARPEPAAEVTYFRIVHTWLDAAVTGFEHIRDNRSDIDSEFPTRGVALLPLACAGADPLAADAGSDTAAIATEEAETQQASNVIPIKERAERKPSSRQQDMQLADEGAKVLAAKQSIRMTPESLDHLLNLTSQAQQLGVRSSQATLRNKGAATELQGRLSSVRSHIAKIADRALRNVTAKGNQSSDMDALEMDQYSELQEAANILREGVEDLDDLINHSIRQTGQVEAMLKQQASVISFLGSSIQAARVVPVSRLMPGLRRIVRTVSSDLGKAVQFRVINEVGSLDRDNHARCQVILEHMVRNALDHGIESPADRIAAGKPTAGLITIDVNKQGGDYIVELTDDGRGIDPDVMRETAFEKGLDIDVDALSDEEAQQLIFHKGFSTASVLSEISGRGVGMDIVISELQQIGGDIDIESVVGKGTTFRVRIPSNLILNGALLVTAGRASYAIPLDGLIAVEHVPCEVFYDAVQNKKSLSLFGMDCEPSYLATLCHGEGLPENGSWGATVPVIIAGSGERHMAVAIDDVKEALELVIRSLGVQFSMVPGVTGAATTSDGQAIVALDLNALVASLAPDELSTISVEHRSEENMLVLVVDDSRTQRLVATSRFDTLGVETVTAENGMVAMEFLNSTHRLPDVVLLDVEMPVKDGIQTLRDIRASSRLRDLPVIMVTSRTGAKHRNLAEQAGCNGYMGKPFNFPVLVEMIAELTDRELQLA